METEEKNSNNSNNFYKILSVLLFVALIIVLAYFLFFNKKEEEKPVTPPEPEKPVEKGTVYYDNDNYTCYEGEQITALITADHPSEVVKVSKYSSDDSNIATVSKHPTETVKCINCVSVQITCVKEGTTNLVAESDYGATTSVPIKVEKKQEQEVPESIGKISYDRDSFSCTEGEKITSVIKAEGNTGAEGNVIFATVDSYNSSNPDIATVTKHPTEAVNCINCVAVQITCKKKGETTLLAKSTLGAKTSVPIKVDTPPVKSSIEYDQKSYSCKVGEKLTAIIKTHGEQKVGDSSRFAMVSSYDSSDRSIATVIKHPNLAVNCINCVAVQITCKKEGKTTLKATSSFNDKTSVPITVK